MIKKNFLKKVHTQKSAKLKTAKLLIKREIKVPSKQTHTASSDCQCAVRAWIAQVWMATMLHF